MANVGGGNVANVLGTLIISNIFTAVATHLIINDSAATTPKNVKIGNTAVRRLAENHIEFALANLAKLTVKGGFGGTNGAGVSLAPNGS